MLSVQPTQCNQPLSWAVLVEEIYQYNPQLPLTMVSYRYPTHTHTHTHTHQIIISSQIGWSQFPTAWFLCLFLTVLAMFLHHSRQGVIQGGSIQQSHRRNRIPWKKAQVLWKTIPVLTSLQGDVRTKIEPLDDWELKDGWKGVCCTGQDGWVRTEAVTSRWLPEHTSSWCQNISRSVTEPQVSGHQSTLHGQACYLWRHHSPPHVHSASCVSLSASGITIHFRIILGISNIISPILINHQI